MTSGTAPSGSWSCLAPDGAGNSRITYRGVLSYPDSALRHARLLSVVAIPDASGRVPGNMNGDGHYDDVNGNGVGDFADVVLFDTQMSWIAATEPPEVSDCSGNGRIDFADVVWLFNRL